MDVHWTSGSGPWTYRTFMDIQRTSLCYLGRFSIVRHLADNPYYKHVAYETYSGLRIFQVRPFSSCELRLSKHLSLLSIKMRQEHLWLILIGWLEICCPLSSPGFYHDTCNLQYMKISWETPGSTSAVWTFIHYCHEMTPRVSVNFISHVTYLELWDEEPPTAYSMSLTRASHIVETVLTGW